jgi:hypothetical protein
MGAPPTPPVTLQRRRSPVLLVLGVLVLAASVIGLAVAIVDLVATAGFDDDEVVAEGVVGPLNGDAGEPATFTAGGDGPYTVWIQTDGINEENRRENVIAATRCEVELPGGDTASFQGNRQGNAITIEDDSTVGWYTASEGQNRVACHQEPFGRQRTWLDDEHGFVVVPGKPASPLVGIVIISLAVVGILVGIGVLTRWHHGRVVTT